MMATLLVPDGTYTANGVTVKEYDLTQHNVNKISMPSKRTLPLIGITIHNTDDINEARQTTDPEQYVRATVNGNMGTVRVHYYVDDDEAWQMLPLDLQGWHAGQRGRYDQWGSEAGNAQTISIECIMDGKGGDKDKRAEDNCARLTAWLLRKYGLSLGQVYTHNYWCNVRNGKKGTVDELNKLNDGYKNCPIYIRPHWDAFMHKVNGYRSSDVANDTLYRLYVQIGAYRVKTCYEEALDKALKDYPSAIVSITDEDGNTKYQRRTR